MVTVGGSVGLLGRPGISGRDRPVVGWRGAWGGACQKLSQVVGMRDATSQVVRMASPEPGSQTLPAVLVVEVRGAEAQQDRLDDRCVIEKRVGYRIWLYSR